MDLIYRFDPFQPIVPRHIDSPGDAIRTLTEGNELFVRIIERVRGEFQGNHGSEPLLVPLDPLTLGVAMIEGASVGQAPYAIVLGCSDARAPVELIFQQSSNDLFVVRVAGNVLGVECLGSIDFAVRKMAASLKLVLILGHTGCGAVTAAVDMYLEPTDYPDLGLTHSLRSIIDRVMIAVRGAAKALNRSLGESRVDAAVYRAALIDLAVFLNAALTSFDVRRELRLVEGGSSIEVAYGVFDIQTQRVLSRPGGVSATPLAAAPAQAAEFDVIAEELARAIVAGKHLKPA
jgi:carbonic anhydrase